MSKKSTPDKKATTPAKRPAKPAAKKQPAPQLAVAAKPVAAKPIAAKPVKAAKAKIAARPVASATKMPAFTRDDIALRAYFIAEKRRHLGQAGDESHDWIEAERQLLAESKPAKKAPVRKTRAK